MLSPAPRAVEELGFFSDEGVWGQEEEQRRGTGAGVSLQSLSRGHCAFSVLQSRVWKAAARGIGEQHALDASGAGRIMSCRAAPEPWGAVGSPARRSCGLKVRRPECSPFPPAAWTSGPPA